MIFRQTINAVAPTNRGFSVVVNRNEQKIMVSFDARRVDARHSHWLAEVRQKTGLGQLDPQPYWGFDDLFHKAGTKLLNCFYVVADVKLENGCQFYAYNKILKLEKFSLDCFLNAIQGGDILIDFDARTGHNHGTKFRLRQGKLPSLYNRATEL